MIKSYLQTAFRNLLKNKSATVIHLFGLTAGLTACVLMALYITHEVSFDRFQQKGDRLARVIMEYRFDGSGQSNAGPFSSSRVASVFPVAFPEIESAVRLYAAETIVRTPGQMFSEKKFVYADSNFFQVFSFPLVAGNPSTVLSAPRSLVLSRSTARKYFGATDPVGRTLIVGNDSAVYQVTGVMADFPTNSQVQADMLGSFGQRDEAEGKEGKETYWNANYTTYLLFHRAEGRATLERKLPAFMDREMAGKGATVRFHLEPFLRVHLYSPYPGFEPGNNIRYIYMLGAVALLILVIACSTYINLNTARSMERAREVGVRKVMGAGKAQLFWQFIGESFMVCGAAMALSLLLAWSLLPLFYRLTATTLLAADLFRPGFLLLCVGITAVVGLLAGSYPALVLTSFQPVRVLKGNFRNTGAGQWLRQSLIVGQVTISVFLIISTLVIQKQLFFIRHTSIGFDRSQVLVLPMSYQMVDRLPLLKSEFRKNPDVLRLSAGVSTPVDIHGGYNMRSEEMPSNEQLAVTATPVDQDYVQTAGFELVAGTDLTRQDVINANPTDGKTEPVFQFILNETGVRALGWKPVEAIGKKMFLDATRPGYVKGVVRDFHFESLHKPIRPLVLFPDNSARNLMVRLSGQRLPQTLAFLEKEWKRLVPGRPFDYHFLDEDFGRLYASEERLGTMMNLFAGLAIVLACLGLSGLASYAAQQRAKEIGVRKVLGATIGNIILTLSGDFLRLTVIALVIAIPLVWWSMQRWLQDYSYRIRLPWNVFFAGGLAVLAVVFVTVAVRAWRAANANPVKSLRE